MKTALLLCLLVGLTSATYSYLGNRLGYPMNSMSLYGGFGYPQRQMYGGIMMDGDWPLDNDYYGGSSYIGSYYPMSGYNSGLSRRGWMGYNPIMSGYAGYAPYGGYLNRYPSSGNQWLQGGPMYQSYPMSYGQNFIMDDPYDGSFGRRSLRRRKVY